MDRGVVVAFCKPYVLSCNEVIDIPLSQKLLGIFVQFNSLYVVIIDYVNNKQEGHEVKVPHFPEEKKKILCSIRGHNLYVVYVSNFVSTFVKINMRTWKLLNLESESLKLYSKYTDGIVARNQFITLVQKVGKSGLLLRSTDENFKKETRHMQDFVTTMYFNSLAGTLIGVHIEGRHAIRVTVLDAVSKKKLFSSRVKVLLPNNYTLGYSEILDRILVMDITGVLFTWKYFEVGLSLADSKNFNMACIANMQEEENKMVFYERCAYLKVVQENEHALDMLYFGKKKCMKIVYPKNSIIEIK